MSTNKDPPKHTGYTVLRIIRTVLIYLFSIGIIIAALLFASSRTPNKSLFGFRYYTVLTPSMEPAYSVGDMVFVKITSADNINVGDVITFNPSSDSEAYLTHRVTEKLVDYQGTGVTCFRTKGDANDSEDSFLIDEGRVIGTVKLGIPKLGYVVRFVQLRWYFVVPILILIFVFIKLMGMYLAPKEEDEEAPEKEPDGEPDKAPEQAPDEETSGTEAPAPADSTEPPEEDEASPK